MNLPINKQQAQTASKWLLQHFGGIIDEYTAGTPYSRELVCAIACQETAYRWLYWIDNYSPNEILARCVFDATMELKPGERKAFPQSQQEFRLKYGSLTDELITEANKMRAMPQPDAPGGYTPRNWLYAGYGIFQYDAQAILIDESFFRNKEWYSIVPCLQRLINELNKKAARADNLRGIVKAYNGSGPAAEHYSNNVMQFMQWV